jgi:hypothetical protein
MPSPLSPFGQNRTLAIGSKPDSLQLDAFRTYYNNTRPHRALGKKTPLFAFNGRLKARPQAAKTVPRWCGFSTVTVRGTVPFLGRRGAAPTSRWWGKIRGANWGVFHAVDSSDNAWHVFSV